MRLKKAVGYALAASLLLFSAHSCKTPDIKNLESIVYNFSKKKSTFDTYGKNIKYYNFSELPEDLIPKEEVKLPSDLEYGINSCFNRPNIRNPYKFREEVLKEAEKLGYTEEMLKSLSPKEAIFTASRITGSKINYHLVDSDPEFIGKYGTDISSDEYFYIGLGDCDKYRNITIGIFDIMKEINPNLKNVYLSSEMIGGYMDFHAWVSIIIPCKEDIMLCHVDPTFDDNNGKFECEENHIMIKNEGYKAYFYKGIYDYETAYTLFEDSIKKQKNDEFLETLLADASFTLFMESHYKPEFAAERIEKIIQTYEEKGFDDHLDSLLYRAFMIYKETGDKEKAKYYKQRLFKEFPDSYWVKDINKHKK